MSDPVTSTASSSTTTPSTTTESSTTSSTSTTTTVAPANTTATTTTVPVPRPDASTDLLAHRGVREISLWWTAPSGSVGITGYDVLRTVVGTSTWTIVATNVRGTSFTNSGLANATKYAFRVRARNATGPGPWSNTAAAITFAFASAPGRPTLTPFGSRSLQISWSRSTSNGGTPVTRYVVQQRRSGATSWTTPTLSGTGPQITGLEPGVRYYYRVAAVNAVGQGPWSTTGSGVPFGPPSAPRNPAASARPGSAIVYFHAPETTYGLPIKSYVLQRSTPGTTSWKTVTTDARWGTIVTGLQPGVRYSFRVAAYTSAGRGEWSTTATTVPAPVGLTVSLRADRTTTYRGGTVTFTVSITNTSAWTTGFVYANFSYQYPAWGTDWVYFVSYSSNSRYLGTLFPMPGAGTFQYSYYGIPPGVTVTQTVTLRFGPSVPSGPLTTRLRAVLENAQAGPSTALTITVR
jgi:hypothetical protein